MEVFSDSTESTRLSSHVGPIAEKGSDDLNDPIIKKILPFSRLMHFYKNDEVIIEGTESQYFYYVYKGSIEVSYTVGDTKITVALIGAGNFFGEIGFFDGISRVRDIRATDDSEIRVFNRETLYKLQEDNPVLYAQFLTVMTKNICAKFRRVLEEREPLAAFAASLSTGSREYEESKPLPETFFKTSGWHTINRIVEEFKAKIYNLSYRLQKDSSTEIPEVLHQKCDELLGNFNSSLKNFGDSIENIEDKYFVWGYVFKEIFPYFMRSRFAERTYYKPKGYAGDFLMMEMIYRNKPDGDGKLGTLVDEWLLNSIPAKAVRGRRELLSKQLKALSRERLEQGNSIRIMNLACGPNRELFDFLSQCDYSEKIEALCVDIDSEALQYTNQHVNVFPHKASIRFMNENLIKWALGRVRHNFGLQDIIYSSGLTDYLDRRLFLALIGKCYEQLKPGGILMIGNFSTNNPDRIFMDYVLHWKLEHRDEIELEDLFANSSFGGNLEILSETQKVNLFAVATKAG
jgi:extracellular factor (EF) 3-hydroxypalmitic acid methyl ester biosynthesis protein